MPDKEKDHAATAEDVVKGLPKGAREAVEVEDKGSMANIRLSATGRICAAVRSRGQVRVFATHPAQADAIRTLLARVVTDAAKEEAS